MSGKRKRSAVELERRVVRAVAAWAQASEHYTAQNVVALLRQCKAPPSSCERVLADLLAVGALNEADVRSARRLLKKQPAHRRSVERLYVLAKVEGETLAVVYGSLAPDKPRAWTLGMHCTELMRQQLKAHGYKAVEVKLEVTL